MAIVSYVWGSAFDSGRSIRLAALVFATMAVPVLLLQSGFGRWLIPVTVIVGFALGAVCGGTVGRRVRRWVLAGGST